MASIVTKYVGSSEIYRDLKFLIRNRNSEEIVEGILRILEKDIEERKKLSNKIEENQNR